jgi:hypothetical protein
MTNTRMNDRYRVNPSSYRELRWGSTFIDGFGPLHAKIKKQHPILATTFPFVRPRESNQLEPISWDAPYENPLNAEGEAVMFVVPWLYIGGADVGVMRMIQLYVEKGCVPHLFFCSLD